MILRSLLSLGLNLMILLSRIGGFDRAASIVLLGPRGESSFSGAVAVGALLDRFNFGVRDPVIRDGFLFDSGLATD